MPKPLPLPLPPREAASAARAARAGAAAPARLHGIDRARGLALVLVVLGHALGGLLDAGLLARRGVAGALYDVIYIAHMPLFFFLAGLFVPARLARDGQAFVRASTLRLGWPLLLWATLQWLVIAALGTHVNRPVEFDLARLATLVWSAPSQFWFLQTLLLLQLLAWALLPRVGAWAWLATALAARALLEADLVALPEPLVQPCRFALFFALGLCIGPARLEGAGAALARDPLIALLMLAWWLTGVLVFRADMSPWSLAALPGALAGGAALLLAAGRVRGQWGDALAALGRHAMAVFLLHVLFVAGTRIVGVQLGLEQPLLLLAAACVLGIAGPLLVRAMALRLRVAGALGLA